MKFDELYKKVIDSCRMFEERRVPISIDFKIEDLRDALVESNDTIEKLKQKLEDEREFGLNRAKNADYEIGKLNEKILVLEKSYKKLVKRFVHETSVAESYRSLVYKEDALKYQKVGNSEMYEEFSKRSDKAYRHANRWRRIFRKMSQEEK